MAAMKHTGKTFETHTKQDGTPPRFAQTTKGGTAKGGKRHRKTWPFAH